MNIKSKSALLSGLVATVVLIGASPAPGSGTDGGATGIVVHPNPAAGDVSTAMLTALQRDLNVTAEQAKARLIRADWASRVDPTLSQRLGKAYAGSWLAEDGHEYVVAITDRRHEKLVRASGATPKLVVRGEAELRAADSALQAHAGRAKIPDEVAGWAVDPQTNGLKVEFVPGGRAAAEAWVAAAGPAVGPVAFEAGPGRAKLNHDVKGGQIYFPTPGGFPVGPVPNWCSTGFAVTFGTTPGLGRPGYLTAGHCYGPEVYVGNPTTSVPVHVHQGRFASSIINDEHDEGAVLTDPGFVPLPIVHGHGRPDILVGDGTTQIDGSPVCLSGATSGLQCGTIRPGVFHPLFPGSCLGCGQKRNLKASTVCSHGGDSGGAVISSTHAQGIHIGSNGCPFFFRKAYYVPLQRALSAMGAVLRTTTVPTTTPPPNSPSQKWTTAKRFWGGLDGGVRGKVASASLNPGHLQVFGRGTDNLLYTKTSVDGVWGAWQGLGDFLTEPPTVLARSGGIDVYYRGGDTRAYWRRFNGSGWEAPVRLGTLDVEGPIFALSPQPGHAILFARGADNEVYFNFTDGVAPWSGWSSLDGDANDAPTAIARTNAAGQIVIEVYARWADDNVRYRRLDPAGPPGWQPWVNLGGIWKTTPVGVTVGPNQSWLVGWANDNTAHAQRFKDGSWLPAWRGVGGDMQSPPTVIGGPGERLRILARDANQQINTISWLGGTVENWERWTSLEGATTSPVGAASRTVADQTSVIDVFGIDTATAQPFHTVLDAGLRLAVGTNSTSTAVGDSAVFTITGPPGAPVSWSATQNGVVREDHAFYDQYLDGNGEFTWYAGDWAGSATGSWVRQAHVGTQNQQTAQVAFTVVDRPVTIETESDAYGFGSFINFVITGPANQQTSWTTWHNGVLRASDAPGPPTDGNGMLITEPAPWIDFVNGTYVIQIRIGSQTAQVTFVFDWPQPPVINPPITAKHSNKCLDVEGHTVNDGARVIQSDCVPSVNTWRHTDTGWIAEHSGKCLEVASASAGAHTYQWTCNGSPLQRWHGVNATPEWWENLYHIVSTTTGMCLTVADASLAHGAAVVQMPCTGAANQIWHIGDPIIPPGPAESIPA